MSTTYRAEYQNAVGEWRHIKDDAGHRTFDSFAEAVNAAWRWALHGYHYSHNPIARPTVRIVEKRERITNLPIDCEVQRRNQWPIT